MIVGLVVALVFALGGSDEAAADSSSARASGPDGEYVAAVRPPLSRLSTSVKVTSRSLANASRPRDVARVSRTARQQLALVQEMRSRIADVPRTDQSRRAAGELSRATQAHRQYLIALSRVSSLPAKRALKSLPGARNEARKALVHYRAVGRQIPGSVGGITTSGIADISGLRTALRAKVADEERAEREAAEARERARAASRPAAPSNSGSSGGSTYSGPVVSGVTGHDAGGTINVSASYCDRTPGAVNQFRYTFTLNGQSYASDSYTASQTRACNQISWNFPDGFPLGPYSITVTVDNLTNNVSGSGTGSVSVVN